MSKITPNDQKFFDLLISSGLVSKKNADQITLLWATAHKGNPCQALVEKSKDESRIGKPCGKECVKNEDTCMCHLPEEKRAVFKEKALQTRRENSEKKKLAKIESGEKGEKVEKVKQVKEPKEHKQPKEKKVKEHKEPKEPKEKKIKEPKEPKEKKVKEPKEPKDQKSESDEPKAPKKQKKQKKQKTEKAVDTDSSEESDIKKSLTFDDIQVQKGENGEVVESVSTVESVETVTTVATLATVETTCIGIIKTGAKKGTMCGKKVKEGTTVCEKHK